MVDPAWIAVLIGFVGQVVIGVWMIGKLRAALLELKAEHTSTAEAVDRLRTYMREIDERSRQNRDDLVRVKTHLGLDGGRA